MLPRNTTSRRHTAAPRRCSLRTGPSRIHYQCVYVFGRMQCTLLSRADKDHDSMTEAIGGTEATKSRHVDFQRQLEEEV